MSRGRGGKRGGGSGPRNTYNNVRANNSQPQHFTNPSRNGPSSVSLNHSSSSPSPAQSNNSPQNYVYSNQYQAQQSQQGYQGQNGYQGQGQQGYAQGQYGGYSNQSSGYQGSYSSGKERSRGGLLGQSPYARAPESYARAPQNESWNSASSAQSQYDRRSGGGYGGHRAEPSSNIVDAMTANITQIVSTNLASILQTNQGNQGQAYHNQDPSRGNHGAAHSSYRRSPPRSRGLENRLGPVQQPQTKFIVRDNIGKYNNPGAAARGSGRPVHRRPPPQNNQQAKKQKGPVPQKNVPNPHNNKAAKSKGANPQAKQQPQKKKAKAFMKFKPAATKAREARWKTVKVDYKITVLEKAEGAGDKAMDVEVPAVEAEIKEEVSVVESETPVVAMEADGSEVVAVESEESEVVKSETPEPADPAAAEHENLDFTTEEDSAVAAEGAEVPAEVVEGSDDTPAGPAEELQDLGDAWKESQGLHQKMQPKANKTKKFQLPPRTQEDIIKLHIEKAACAIHSLFVESENKIAELLGKAKAETPYFCVTLTTSAEDLEAAPGKLFEETFVAPARSDFKFVNSMPIFNDDEWEMKGGD